LANIIIICYLQCNFPHNIFFGVTNCYFPLLGVTLDTCLTFNQHVSSVYIASFFHLRALWHILPVLTKDMTVSIAVTLVQSRLDYANSLLYHTSAYNINELQRVQNMAALLVIPNSQLSIADILSRLHWLPISKRTDFKTAAITYKVLHW